MSWYYFSKEGNIQGPTTAAFILTKYHYKTGEITKATLVWNVECGVEEWSELSSVYSNVVDDVIHSIKKGVVSKKLLSFMMNPYDVYIYKKNELKHKTRPIGKAKIEIEYKGYLANTIINTDSNKNKLQPFIQNRELISLGIKKNAYGLEMALYKIREGEECEIYIPWRLAYGEKGAGHLVPAKTDILFELKIHKIEEQGSKWEVVRFEKATKMKQKWNTRKKQNNVLINKDRYNANEPPKMHPIPHQPQAKNKQNVVLNEWEEKQNKGYDDGVVTELVELGFGTMNECIYASKMVVDYKNINIVVDKLKEIKHKSSIKQSDDDEKVADPRGLVQGFQHDFVSELKDLIGIIEKHIKYMNEQESKVNKMIFESTSSEILSDAKKVALITEKELMQKISNISSMNDFLQKIILIENLFNSIYSSQQRLNQQKARKKYAKNIEIYEKKRKPISNIESFFKMTFYAKTALSEFKKWLKSVEMECNKKYIKIISNSGAKEKNIERAFYKSFYVYSTIYGINGHKQMTDILRCSLVFDSFDDIYKCFGIIQDLALKNGGYGILRCKDRFNPKQIAFGYRDLLINIQCPGSKIICEIQLHHQLFYKHKKISHDMYKKARLFEVGDVNLAYNYADKYVRDTIGNDIYQYENVNISNLDPKRLLNEWGLSQYENILINKEGYDDIIDWKDLSLQELKNMGFKTGHGKKFIRRAHDI